MAKQVTFGKSRLNRAPENPRENMEPSELSPNCLMRALMMVEVRTLFPSQSGRDVQELKEKYGGTFVEGVEIGERLAVYEDRDFTFVE